MKSKEQLYELITKINRDRSQYLKELFKYVPEAVAKEIAYAEIKKDEYIIKAGEDCDTVYFLLKGDVKGVDYLQDGRIYSFLDFSRMYIVGDFELFSGEFKSIISVLAADECKVLKLSAKSYMRWIQCDENALMLRLEAILKVLIMETKGDRENMVRGCTERLVNYLVKYYEREYTSSYLNVKVDLTQTEIADRIGFNVRSVQRSINALEKDGLISIVKGKIVVSAEQCFMLKEYEAKKEGARNGKI